MDIRLALACGTDIFLEELNLILHNPPLKEIALIGEEDFFSALGALTIDKQRLAFLDEFESLETNNFQLFMMIVNSEKKKCIEQCLKMLFPRYTCFFTPNSIIFSENNNDFIIDAENFEIFQGYLSKIFGLNGKDKGPEYNPVSEKAKQIAQKLMKGRKKVSQIKEAGQEGKEGLGKMCSILAVGIPSMSLEDITNLTVYQLNNLLNRYRMYLSWDIDLRSRLAGAKIEKEPEDWMRDIE